MKTSIFLIGVLFAQAAYSQSILNCGAPVGGLKNCSFVSFPAYSKVIDNETFESVYKITLNGSCSGSNFKLPIQFQAGSTVTNSAPLFLNKQSQEFLAEGNGPLTLVDPNPNYTAKFKFPQNCDITVGAIEALPNTNALNLWLARATSTTKLLNFAYNAWIRKGEFMYYYESYISGDIEGAGSVLQEIASALDPEDPLLVLINSILNSAPPTEIEAYWAGLKGNIQTMVTAGESHQRKLVYALGAENAELAAAIKNGKSALNQ